MSEINNDPFSNKLRGKVNFGTEENPDWYPKDNPEDEIDYAKYEERVNEIYNTGKNSSIGRDKRVANKVVEKTPYEKSKEFYKKATIAIIIAATVIGGSFGIGYGYAQHLENQKIAAAELQEVERIRQALNNHGINFNEGFNNNYENLIDSLQRDDYYLIYLLFDNELSPQNRNAEWEKFLSATRYRNENSFLIHFQVPILNRETGEWELQSGMYDYHVPGDLSTQHTSRSVWLRLEREYREANINLEDNPDIQYESRGL